MGTHTTKRKSLQVGNLLNCSIVHASVLMCVGVVGQKQEAGQENRMILGLSWPKMASWIKNLAYSIITHD